MKKAFIVFFCLCILLCGCSNDRSLAHESETPDTFVFDKSSYSVITNFSTGDATYIEDVYDLERQMMGWENGSELGLIAECTVTGESINWIVEPPLAERKLGVIYGKNHVLTPVRIDRILYAGTSVNVTAGTEFLLVEPYFYITDETPDYQKRYKTTEITAAVDDYNPVVKGNSYLIFLRLHEYYSGRDFAYPAEEGNLFFQPMYRQLSIYGIGNKETVAKDLVTVHPNFWSSWEQVMDVYVNSKSDTPFTKPQIYTGELSQ